MKLGGVDNRGRHGGLMSKMMWEVLATNRIWPVVQLADIPPHSLVKGHRSWVVMYIGYWGVHVLQKRLTKDNDMSEDNISKRVWPRDSLLFGVVGKLRCRYFLQIDIALAMCFLLFRIPKNRLIPYVDCWVFYEIQLCMQMAEFWTQNYDMYGVGIWWSAFLQ